MQVILNGLLQYVAMSIGRELQTAARMLVGVPDRPLFGGCASLSLALGIVHNLQSGLPDAQGTSTSIPSPTRNSGDPGSTEECHICRIPRHHASPRATAYSEKSSCSTVKSCSQQSCALCTLLLAHGIVPRKYRLEPSFLSHRCCNRFPKYCIVTC